MKAELLITATGIELRIRPNGSPYDQKFIKTVSEWTKLQIGAESVLTIPIALPEVKVEKGDKGRSDE